MFWVLKRNVSMRRFFEHPKHMFKQENNNNVVLFFHAYMHIKNLLIMMCSYDSKYRSTSLSQSPREQRKYFELSEVRHKQNVTSPKYNVCVQFLQATLLQYMCSKTVPTENRIEMKTKEIHLCLFYKCITILITLWTVLTPQA